MKLTQQQINNMVPYYDYPEDVKESIRKTEARIKMLKEEERRNFPFKKKGFRKHIR